MPCYVITKADGSKEEHRGMMLWVWGDRRGVEFMFEPSSKFPVAHSIIVPIGWSLQPDEMAGVMVEKVGGDAFDAGSTMNVARKGFFGFRLIGEGETVAEGRLPDELE